MMRSLGWFQLGIWNLVLLRIIGQCVSVDSLWNRDVYGMYRGFTACDEIYKSLQIAPLTSCRLCGFMMSLTLF